MSFQLTTRCLVIVVIDLGMDNKYTNKYTKQTNVSVYEIHPFHISNRLRLHDVNKYNVCLFLGRKAIRYSRDTIGHIDFTL